MERKYYCKYCGDSHAALSFLISGVCSKSPNRRQQLYTGRREAEEWDGTGEFQSQSHYCTYCGHSNVTIARVTAKSCTRSPTGYHQPYEGEDKPGYVCKYCNSSSRSIERLTRSSCSASPNKHHQPTE